MQVMLYKPAKDTLFKINPAVQSDHSNQQERLSCPKNPQITPARWFPVNNLIHDITGHGGSALPELAKSGQSKTNYFAQQGLMKLL
jgi:hypothetical protein